MQVQAVVVAPKNEITIALLGIALGWNPGWRPAANGLPGTARHKPGPSAALTAAPVPTPTPLIGAAFAS